MEAQVISLLRARRRFDRVGGERQWHPIPGHTAKIIPFPQKVLTDPLTLDARNGFDCWADGCRRPAADK